MENIWLQKTKFSSSFKDNERNDDLESSSKVLSCHVCNSHNTDLIPISSNESFRIDYNVTRGMEIEFYRSNEIVDRQQESPEQQIVPVSLV
jgi:hypothetical protein